MVLNFQTSELQNTDSDFQVSLLGMFRISSCDGHLELTARKDMALLAYLANTPSKVVRRSSLAAVLWSNSNDTRARESLKQSLLRLKKILPDGLLLTDRQSVQLLLDQQQVDVSVLQKLVACGTTDSVAKAADTLCGDFLSGLEDVSAEFEEWRIVQHQKLVDTVKHAALKIMQQELALDNIDTAQAFAKRVQKLDPLDEEAIRCLIAAYSVEGRGRQAKIVFNEFKNRLHRELGVEPEPATQSLIHSLVSETPDCEVTELSMSPRIAVLPFNVGENESSQKYFAEGLTDDITTDLARTKDLEVVPISAIASLQGDRLQAAKSRGATHVLNGSVRRSDGRLRVNTTLIDTLDSQIVWAERYDRSMDAVFEMQDTISSQIVMRLQLELSPKAMSNSVHGTRNPFAYEMFHKGRSLYLRGINNQSLRASKALLERTIEIDPEFARAYAQLAICESYLAMSIANKTGENLTDQVLQHAHTALKITPDLALGHAAEGLAYYAAGRYSDAEKALQNSLNFDSNLFEAQFFLARNRRLLGDHRGAVVRFRNAATLRPDDFRSSGLLGEELKAIGEVDEAESAFQVSIERIEAELEMHPDNAGALAFGAPILAESGRQNLAMEWCAWALAIDPNDCLLRYNLARLFAISGNTNEALEQLKAAFSAPPLVQRRLALWMRYDMDFKLLEGNNYFNRLLKYATHDHNLK